MYVHTDAPSIQTQYVVVALGLLLDKMYIHKDTQAHTGRVRARQYALASSRPTKSGTACTYSLVALAGAVFSI